MDRVITLFTAVVVIFGALTAFPAAGLSQHSQSLSGQDFSDPPEQPTEEIEVSIEGNVVIGSNVTVIATLNGTPVGNATVTVNAEVAGTTNSNGTLNVTVPNAEVLEILIQTQNASGSVSLPIQNPSSPFGDINISIAGNLTPGNNVTMTATLNGSPVVNASGFVNNETVGTTDQNGTLMVTVPDADQMTIIIETANASGTLTVPVSTPAPEPGPVPGDPPSNIADWSNTTPLGPNQVEPPSLAGKLRVESTVVSNTSIELIENSSTNFSLAITVTGNATNVTFYIQEQAVSSSQNLTNLSMYLDGQPHSFYASDAGPGDSPWAAFEIEHFSTRTISFESTSEGATIALANVTGSPGQNVTVPLTTDATDVAGYAANVSFNSSVVKVQSVEAGPNYSSPTAAVDNEAGWVMFTASQTNGVDQPTLANITFKVDPNATSNTQLTFIGSGTVLNDEQGDTIPIGTFETGSVTIANPTPPIGEIKISIAGNLTPGSNVTVTATLNGSPVGNASGFVNNETVGTTDQNGTLKVPVPDADQMTITIESANATGTLTVPVSTPAPEPGPSPGDPPSSIADWTNTTPLGPNDVDPPSLAGKIRVESNYASNTTVNLIANSSTNYTFAITVTGNATNVTFYLQEQAISSSQNLTEVSMYLDGQPHTFYASDAGPGNSPWAAFEIQYFSTRTISFQSSAESVTITLDNVSGTPGDNVMVPLSTDAANVSGYSANVTFDSNILQVQSVQAGPNFSAPVANINNGAGWVMLTASQATGVDQPRLANITFKVDANASSNTQLSFVESGTALNDDQGDAIPIGTFVNGSVSIEGCSILGDVNGNGEVDPADATLAQRVIVDLPIDTPFNEDCADMNQDGEVTPADVTLIQRKIVGLPPFETNEDPSHTQGHK